MESFEQKEVLHEAGQLLLNRSMGIEDWWKRYSTFLTSVENVTDANDVTILCAAYYRYGCYLFEHGYVKKAYVLIEKSLTVVNMYRQLLCDQYNSFYTTITETKVSILCKLGRHREAYKLMNQLHGMDPDKDEYKISLRHIFSAYIWELVWPCYSIVAVLYLLGLADRYLLKCHFFPTWLWDVCWIVWIILIVIQFVLPTIMKKIKGWL